jgi:hypothetical protein
MNGVAGMGESPGRNAAFQGGAMEVKYPSFQTQQQGSGGGYQFHSVLDNVQPSGNGASMMDRSRMYRGGKLPSINGSSPDTDAKSQWLNTPYRTFG